MSVPVLRDTAVFIIYSFIVSYLLPFCLLFKVRCITLMMAPASFRAQVDLARLIVP